MTKKAEQKVYIVILNYNNTGDSIECIQSILKNADQTSYKIILIDNGSKDFNEESVAKLSSAIQIIKSPVNLGYSGGVNIGIKKALEDNIPYTLLLNNDTIVEKNFLSKLLTTAEKNPPGIIAPLITYYDNPDLVWFRGGSIGKYSGITHHLNMNKNKSGFDNTKAFDTGFITGCCMLVNNSVFKKIGLYDDTYFIYNEDIDFCYRCRQNNISLIVDPSSEIRHKISASTNKGQNTECDPHRITRLKAFYWARNDYLFIRKNMKGLAKITATLALFFIKHPYFCLYILRQKKWAEFKEYFRGILAGFNHKTSHA